MQLKNEGLTYGQCKLKHLGLHRNYMFDLTTDIASYK